VIWLTKDNTNVG